MSHVYFIVVFFQQHALTLSNIVEFIWRCTHGLVVKRETKYSRKFSDTFKNGFE